MNLSSFILIILLINVIANAQPRPPPSLPSLFTTTAQKGTTLKPGTTQKATTLKPGTTQKATTLKPGTTQKATTPKPATTQKATTLPPVATTTKSLVTTTINNINLDKIITSWKKSNGTGYNGIKADVTGISYDTNYAYISTNSIPSYSIGPWTGNPNLPTAANLVVKFARKAQVSSTKQSVSLGAVGYWINGVAIFNADDGQSYNNQGVWKRNAYFWEGGSFDKCSGHPAPGGIYHNHVNVNCYYDSTDSSRHSPLIGFLYDSYPIYGPFGYSDPTNPSSPIKRIMSGYSLRNITVRTTLPGNTATSYSGPAVSTTYPLGSYLQDYDYYGTGDLDQYNGRWCVTPEYPSGTYAYFVTTTSNGAPAFPYTIGPYKYYGVVNNQTPGTAVPSTAIKYF